MTAQLAVLSVASAVGLLIVEGSLRAVRLFQEPADQPVAAWQDVFAFSPTRHHRLMPNVRFRHREAEFDYLWENNALGMRDRQRRLPKSPGTRRILFLGDSFVQGYGVPLEKSMVALLEESLNRTAGRPTVEILNAGVFGYSPLLEYLYLEELMPIVQPDVILLGLFLGNDIGDDNFHQTAAIADTEDGSLRFNDRRWPWTAMDEAIAVAEGAAPSPVASDSAGRERLPTGWTAALRVRLRRSLLWRTIERTAETVGARRRYRAQMKARDSFAAAHRDDIRLNLAAILYPQTGRDRRALYWQPTRRYLRKISELAAARGVPLIIVVLPQLGRDADAAAFSEPYEFVDQLGREYSVPIVHLRDGFGEESADGLMYPIDGHWNVRGHRVAAASLEGELRRTHLLRLLPGPLSNP